MAIRFTAHITPKPNGRGGEELTHARALCQGTYKMEEIGNLVSARSSVSSADVKAVLDSLSWVIGHALGSGYHVELDELGYFSPSLRTTRKENGKMSVSVDGVNFRCSTKLKAKARAIKLEPVVLRAKRLSPEDEQQVLLDYLGRNGSISPSDYASCLGCSRYRAQAKLTAFVEAGVLRKVGHRNRVLYLKA